MLVRKYDQTTKKFVEDMWLDTSISSIPTNTTEVPVPNGLLVPMFIDGAWIEGASTELLLARDVNKASTIKIIEDNKAKAIGKAYLDTGTMVPFKSSDALAILQVKAAFEVGVASTNIIFSNKEVLPMTSADFPSFAIWFANERNKFFI